MALVGINSALQALKAVEVLQVVYYNAFLGKFLQSGAIARSRRNLKFSELSFVCYAVSSTFGNFQPIDVGASGTGSVGREPTTLEVRKTLLPFLENLEAQHKEGLVEVLLNFPDPPPMKKKILGLQSSGDTFFISVVLGEVNLSNYPHLQSHVVDGHLPDNPRYLFKMGMSPKDSAKILSRFPHIVGYSIEEKLKPITNHFNSIGIVDLETLVLRSPQILGLSMELNIKPTLQFFTNNGYDREELCTIILQFPQSLGLNIERNLRPKWQYFVLMDHCRTEIVVFPQYFGYSLENCIKPRNEALKSVGVDWSLNQMLSTTEILFQKYLEKDREQVDIVRNLISIEVDGD